MRKDNFFQTLEIQEKPTPRVLSKAYLITGGTDTELEANFRTSTLGNEARFGVINLSNLSSVSRL